MTPHHGRVLIIAGSDSVDGAGIQADIKTVPAPGGYAMTAITALTVQNTLGVSAVHDAPIEIVRGQIEAVLSDLGADAIKTGMLSSIPVVELVAQTLEANAAIPGVVDPVMIAKGGAALLREEAVAAVASQLVPRATLVTPNAPEATALTGIEINDVEDQKRAADALVSMGAKAALVKGGHVPGAWVHDVLATRSGIEVFSSERIDTRATHGTGCTLASAIAAGLAQGMEMREA